MQEVWVDDVNYEAVAILETNCSGIFRFSFTICDN